MELLGVSLNSRKSGFYALTVSKNGRSFQFQIKRPMQEVKKFCILSFGQQGPTKLVAKRLKNDWLSSQSCKFTLLQSGYDFIADLNCQ